MTIQKLITTIEKYDRQIEQIKKDIELHHANETNIKHNIVIDEYISHVEYDISTNKKQIDHMEKLLRDLHGEIKVLEANKTDIMNQIKEAEELENTYEAYKYYMEAVGRDGIPYELISTAVPKIGSEINNVLNQMVEFNRVLNTDGKNINGYIIYDEDNYWPLELTSGMEKFIASLAIRTSLINTTSLPRPNFLAIDEGFGVLDSENLNNMYLLFDYLKSQFGFVLCISHIDAMRDIVDKLIEIKKVNGYSKINYS